MLFLSIKFQYFQRKRRKLTNFVLKILKLIFISFNDTLLPSENTFFIAFESKVQKCGCCDLESGRKFILEVGKNLSWKWAKIYRQYIPAASFQLSLLHISIITAAPIAPKYVFFQATEFVTLTLSRLSTLVSKKIVCHTLGKYITYYYKGTL